jgi:DNA invertase Pin-like site-specific DNA recombinase
MSWQVFFVINIRRRRRGPYEAARRDGWALHFADLDIDTGTPVGEMAANIIISGSQHERRLISQRTRDALAAR